MDPPLTYPLPRPPPSLNLDVLTCILPFLSSSPSTLASVALVSTSLYQPATRQLYAFIELKGSPRTYQLFFEAHASPPPPPLPSLFNRPSPLIYTKYLYLGRHFLPPSSSASQNSQQPSTSLYIGTSSSPSSLPTGVQLSNLLLPALPPTLFPNIQTLHLDVHRTHLASILPILISLNPFNLVVSPHPPSASSSSSDASYSHLLPPSLLNHNHDHDQTRPSTAIAYLPQMVFSSYTNLVSATILSTDFHPPDRSDYPPFSRFPFPPSCSGSLRRVRWVHRVEEMRVLGESFFQNLEGVFEWERELEVVLEVVEVREEEEEEKEDALELEEGARREERESARRMLGRSLERVERELERSEEEEETQGLVGTKVKGDDGFEESGSLEHGSWEVHREEVWRFRKVRVRVREVRLIWEKRGSGEGGRVSSG